MKRYPPSLRSALVQRLAPVTSYDEIKSLARAEDVPAPTLVRWLERDAPDHPWLQERRARRLGRLAECAAPFCDGPVDSIGLCGEHADAFRSAFKKFGRPTTHAVPNGNVSVNVEVVCRGPRVPAIFDSTEGLAVHLRYGTSVNVSSTKVGRPATIEVDSATGLYTVTLPKDLRPGNWPKTKLLATRRRLLLA